MRLLPSFRAAALAAPLLSAVPAAGQTLLQHFEPPPGLATSHFGQSVAGAGDVDRDGVDAADGQRPLHAASSDSVQLAVQRKHGGIEQPIDA